MGGVPGGSSHVAWGRTQGSSQLGVLSLPGAPHPYTRASEVTALPMPASCARGGRGRHEVSQGPGAVLAGAWGGGGKHTAHRPGLRPSPPTLLPPDPERLPLRALVFSSDLELRIPALLAS